LEFGPVRHRSLNTTWHMPDKKQLQRELVRDIQQLTNRLRNEFPELYERLGEMPVTLPDDPDPDVDMDALRNYLGSLRNILEQQIRAHGGNTP